MSVLSVQELPDRSGKRTTQGYDYVRTFLVRVDSVETDPDDIRNADGIPSLGDPYELGSVATCIEIDPRPSGDGRLTWKVYCTYTTTPRSVSVTPSTAPWRELPKVRWSSYAIVQALDKDRHGAAILNSAMDPFVPPLEREYTFPVLTISRYEKRFDINTVLLYQDKLNSLAMKICGLVISAEQALMKRIEAENVNVYDRNCWRVVYEIHFAPSWQREVLDQGYYYWHNGYGTGEKRRFKDSDGEDSVVPGLLFANGDENTSPSLGPHFLNIDVYDVIDFAELGLPQNSPV